MFSSFEASGQGHSDLKHVSPIWEFMPCSKGNMLRTQFQKTKVSGQGHSDSKIVRTLQSTTPYCIQTRNLLKYAKDTIILGQLRQEVKVKVTPKLVHYTLRPKMHSHTDLGVPTFNSKGGMLQTRCEDSGTLNGLCDYPLSA